MLRTILLFIFIASTLVQLQAQITFGEMTDARDGQSYKTINIEKEVGFGIVVTHTWLAENLNYEMEGSWCYNDDPENCEQYGRLYTWEAAKKACPEGWHLPTDLEWQQLMHQFGKGGLSYNDGDKSTYQALIQGGNSGFDALLGGNRLSNGEFGSLTKYGGYWGATEGDAGDAWDFNFNSVNATVYRFSNDKLNGQSCRCLQD